MMAISIKNLVKRFGDRVAGDGLSLDIEQGELVALLGMNGAGKTTTINILSGLLGADGGDAFIFGKSVLTQSEHTKQLLNVSLQETAIAENLTVKENLEFVCKIYGFDNEKSQAKTNEIMSRFGLNERKDDRAGKLSGGYKRSVVC